MLTRECLKYLSMPEPETITTYSNVLDLMGAIHVGVILLSTNNEHTPVNVLASDDPTVFPPALGFYLSARASTHEEEKGWRFCIEVQDMRRFASDHPNIRVAFNRLDGRARIAAMLAGGLSPEEIEIRLGDPVVRYIRSRAEELRSAARHVADDFDKEDQETARRLDRRNEFLHHADALTRIALDLDLQKHIRGGY
jgi:hypothetical protein